MTKTIVHGRPPQAAVNRLVDALIEFAWKKEQERLLTEAVPEVEHQVGKPVGGVTQQVMSGSLYQE